MTDVDYMRRALALAAKARGFTSPNPMVGAVVVQGDRVVGEGYHAAAGEPHAEVVALAAAGDAARGATLYVTLEPCAHYGRTPPCTKAVIEAGIRRVVASIEDPNPKVKGRGFAELQKAGISVEVGLLAAEARRLNEAFFTFMERRRPFVLYKAAMSLDGKVAAYTGASRWITSPPAREAVHRLRAEFDAVMVGIGTVLADDPKLTARPPGSDRVRQPVRIVVDSRARIPLSARMLASTASARAIVATTTAAPPAKVARLRQAGVDIWEGEPDAAGRVALAPFLGALAEQGITSILLEGGPRLAGAMLRAGLIDKVLFCIAPLFLGGDGPGPIGGEGYPHPDAALRLSRWETEAIGPDLFVWGYPEGAAHAGEAV
ncbi:MAG TPA: bifunctional diaminohydroxyphosphoribosylaminopyrimidine deaminase/5-amino-6-(5-phosphoribosylamino)uracil reductase RibD [Limnochordia bacterium]